MSGGGSSAATARRSSNPTATAVQQARRMGYKDDPCPECGLLTLVRNGTCLNCESCGATTVCS
jgi:ribonucleoside-diphosphate reductase alpha chain